MSEQPQQEQIPVQFVIEELQDTIRRRDSELLLAGAQGRQQADTIRSLQEQNVALQKRVTELDDAANLPQPA